APGDRQGGASRNAPVEPVKPRASWPFYWFYWFYRRQERPPCVGGEGGRSSVGHPPVERGLPPSSARTPGGAGTSARNGGASAPGRVEGSGRALPVPVPAG